MPKIKTIDKRLDHGSQRTPVKYDVFYSSSEGFFAVLPKAFNAQADALDNADKKAHFMEVEREYKYSSDSKIKRVKVKAATEAQAIERCDALLVTLINSSVTRRDVILVFFKGHSSEAQRTFRSSGVFNKEHSPVDMALSLKYCTEVSVNGGEPKYAVFRMDSNPFDKSEAPTEVREDLSTSSNRSDNFIVIDDTPESREFLENAYGAFVALVEKVRGVLGESDALVAAISSGAKLLK